MSAGTCKTVWKFLSGQKSRKRQPFLVINAPLHLHDLDITSCEKLQQKTARFEIET
jgi:hypothetical protein